MRKIQMVAAAVLLAATAHAKLPPLDDAGKAKAAEATAKAGWNAKVESYKLCVAQDDVVKSYRQNAKSAASDKPPQPLPECVDPGPYAAAAVEKPAATAAAPATAASATAPKLEAAGAHSPPATADSPPVISERKNAVEPAEASKATPMTQPATAASRPIEAAGAHSPAATAVAPPSTVSAASIAVPARPVDSSRSNPDPVRRPATVAPVSAASQSEVTSTQGSASAAARAVAPVPTTSSPFSVSPGPAAPVVAASAPTVAGSAVPVVIRGPASGGDANRTVPPVGAASTTESFPPATVIAPSSSGAMAQTRAGASVEAAIAAATTAAETAAGKTSAPSPASRSTVSTTPKP